LRRSNDAGMNYRMSNMEEKAEAVTARRSRQRKELQNAVGAEFQTACCRRRLLVAVRHVRVATVNATTAHRRPSTGGESCRAGGGRRRGTVALCMQAPVVHAITHAETAACYGDAVLRPRALRRYNNVVTGQVTRSQQQQTMSQIQRTTPNTATFSRNR